MADCRDIPCAILIWKEIHYRDHRIEQQCDFYCGYFYVILYFSVSLLYISIFSIIIYPQTVNNDLHIVIPPVCRRITICFVAIKR